MKSFFIFGITDFQDMATSIIEASKIGNTWVAIFDCLHKKDQFYYYEKDDLINFVENILNEGKKNNVIISFYTKKCQKKYEVDLNKLNPNVIFMQGISHKYPIWVPKIKNIPVVHFTWGPDGINNINKSPYKKNIMLNVLRHEEDISFYRGKTQIPSVYFGCFPYDSLSFKEIGYDSIRQVGKKSKILFLVESWLMGDNKPWDLNSTKNYVEPIIELGKKLDYKIIIKKREKGFPFDTQHGYTNFMKSKDETVIISKDLFFPSLLYGMRNYASKVICIGQHSLGTNEIIKLYNNSGFVNIIHVNKNTFKITNIENFLKKDDKNSFSGFMKVRLGNKENTNPSAKKLMEYISDHLR